MLGAYGCLDSVVSLSLDIVKEIKGTKGEQIAIH